jgi:hypothetical protein
VSIHQQPKASSEEQSSYRKLQALNRYHKLFGVEAVLHKREKDRKAQVKIYFYFTARPKISRNFVQVSKISSTQINRILLSLGSPRFPPKSAKSCFEVYIHRGGSKV